MRGARTRTIVVAVVGALALALSGGGAGAAPADEAMDFQFPGADTMYLPQTDGYVTYGASARVAVAGDEVRYRVPYTLSGSGATPASAHRVDGDAFADITYPSGYWGDRDGTVWTPGAFTKVKAGTRWYYLFYTGTRVVEGTTQHCVGVARSTSPTHGFRAQVDPIACPSTATSWAIDADVVVGPTGGVWMTWRDGQRRDGLDTALSAMLLSVSDSGVVTRASTPVVLLRSGDVVWEEYENAEAVRTVENPSAYYDEPRGRWYLFYSGNNWASNRYATGIAACGADLGDGPCTPVPGPRRATFAFFPEDAAGFRNALPADMRISRLPGNKRGPGAMDVYLAKDGRPWVTWNYISDSWDGSSDPIPRNSRLGRLVVDRSGPELAFSVTQP